MGRVNWLTRIRGVLLTLAILGAAAAGIDTLARWLMWGPAR